MLKLADTSRFFKDSCLFFLFVYFTFFWKTLKMFFSSVSDVLCAISDATNMNGCLVLHTLSNTATRLPPRRNAPMLDIVWFMPIMFPVQVTYTTKCYLILYICVFFVLFFFKREEEKGHFFFLLIYATFRTIVKWSRLNDSCAIKLD